MEKRISNIKLYYQSEEIARQRKKEEFRQSQACMDAWAANVIMRISRGEISYPGVALDMLNKILEQSDIESDFTQP